MASLNKDHRGTDLPGDEQCQVERRTKGLKSPQNPSQSSGSLRDHDWDQLQDEYIDSMEKHEQAEQKLRGHVSKLLEVPRNNV